MPEYAFELWSDKKTVHQFRPNHPAKWCGVFNLVHHKGPRGNGLERVTMTPERVRAFELHIYEVSRWIPLADLGQPMHGNSTHSDSIINASAHMHGNGRGRQYFEANPGWCQLWEVLRVGKKREHVRKRQGNALLKANSFNTRLQGKRGWRDEAFRAASSSLSNSSSELRITAPHFESAGW